MGTKFNKGDKVKWITASGVNGSGRVADCDNVFSEDVMHYIVVVDAPDGEPHPIIYCAETWLTKKED